jgi:ABC-type lipoprotein export system ATPase subunit
MLVDDAALRAGAARFLVDHDHFARLKDDPWIREHVLFAVAAGSDGLGGLKADSAFKAHREELGRIADIVFSGSPNERRYWLGDHPDAEHRISGVKPCLHGSDAHEFDRILSPDGERRCWIRSSATFDGLRQTLIEPRRRVHIGPHPDDSRSQSNVIRRMRLRQAAWFAPEQFTLNEGLVTIIGERGSGKTALADVIALAADARDSEASTASFLYRAESLLAGMEVELEWADGTTSPSRDASARASEHPRVRYLSQQFVERLSQRSGPAVEVADLSWPDEDAAPAVRDPLLEEIERVVFEAIPVEDRLEADGFASLRDAKLGSRLDARNTARDLSRSKTHAIAEENAKKRALTTLKTALSEASRAREAIEREFRSMPAAAPKEHVKAYEDALVEQKKLQDAIQRQAARANRIEVLRSALEQQQARLDEEHEQLRTRFTDLLLEPALWEDLRPSINVSAVNRLAELVHAARALERRLRERGTTKPSVEGAAAAGIVTLGARVEAARKTLGEDDIKSKRRAELVKKLDVARTREEKAAKEHADAQGSIERMRIANDERLQAYEHMLQTLDSEITILDELYEPLKRRLAADERLRPLTFYVSREVNLSMWVAAGARIFDLRRPPFRGRGELFEAAERVLGQAWRSGAAVDVRAALTRFMGEYFNDAASMPRQGVTMLDLGQWLFSTDHISIRYGIRYEGRDISNLSPGARGVVLLTLFLAIDDHDERPLVIDQPEENLDPKSINGLLVPFFVEAARRRQIIMVTHNPNLVVNTDADQVIVATSERSDGNELPHATRHPDGATDRQGHGTGVGVDDRVE